MKRRTKKSLNEQWSIMVHLDGFPPARVLRDRQARLVSQGDDTAAAITMEEMNKVSVLLPCV